MRPVELDLTRPGLAARVLALQVVCSEVEARAMGLTTMPVIHDTPAVLIRSAETFLGVWAPGDTLAGVLAYLPENDGLEITRLMVDPEYFRRGVATRLLLALEVYAVGWHWMRVGTGAANGPALALYRRHGFSEVSRREVVEGVAIATLERRRETAHA